MKQRNFNIKKGRLHAQLGYGKKEKIPRAIIDKIAGMAVGSKIKVNGKTRKVTLLLKRRCVFAKNTRRWRK